MEKKTALYLPSELITEILLRLPVKSLICFKSVCKSWFTLISSPNFSISHFNYSSAAHTRRILSISAIPRQIRSIDFQALLNDHSAPPNPNLSPPQSHFPLRIKGSCRGFIFLISFPYNLLWNPSTGFCKKLPLSPFIDFNFSRYSYGFGYDQSRDDYLVVSLSYNDSRLVHHSSHLEIFSVRDNKWKKIEDPPIHYRSAIDHPKVGLFFNGAIHWFVYRNHSSAVNVIIAFDLMERKLLEMLLPDVCLHYLADFDLWVFGEFLSLCARRNGIVEIWVMREYKVHSSWTRTLVFPIGAIPYFSPIYSTKNGDIFGTIGGTGLVKYNGKGQLLGHCLYCEDPRGSQVIMYTESLLSLPDDNKEV